VSFSIEETWDFIKSLGPLKFEPRDYQVEALCKAIRYKRGIYLSPTASGKSFIIYLLAHYYPGKTLIICPRINLVTQMYKDFIDYDLSHTVENHLQMIKGGLTKDVDKRFTITTYQSITNQPANWFNQFELLVGDEAHGFKADSLKKIMNNAKKTKYKVGFTGTLDDSLTNEMVLRGLFSDIHKITTTRELMDAGHISPLRIHCLVLSYPDEIREKAYKAKNPKKVNGQKVPSQFDYQDEVKFILAYKARNNFIKNLALSLKGNTLILFTRVEDHGLPLHEAIKAKAGNQPVHLVYGKVEDDIREEIRQLIIQGDQSIILASTGVFSEGVNIPNIDNIIFANPSKARIKIMQSIGRGLRLSDGKTHCALYDIADDLSWKKWTNYAMDHYSQRIDMYIQEKFEYKQYTVGLK
jgi:superfamily II DNA or RNA helicase